LIGIRGDRTRPPSSRAHRTLWPEDLERLHHLWLRLSQGQFGSKLHHRDVIGVALRRLQRDLEDEEPNELALAVLDYEVRHH